MKQNFVMSWSKSFSKVCSAENSEWDLSTGISQGLVLDLHFILVSGIKYELKIWIKITYITYNMWQIVNHKQSFEVIHFIG